MKNFCSTLVALTAACFAAVAVAGGSHAGGHGHDASDIGQTGQVARVSRTIQVDMTDGMRFIPDKVAVTQGETIRFVIKNSGQLKHEFVMGTAKELKAHYDLMKKFPNMEHADDNMLTVAPGRTGELIWLFGKAGVVDFACLQPGHYDAGMKGVFEIARTAAATEPNKTTEAKMPVTQDMAQGEIRKIDKDAKKITLKHGDITNLGMPPMTMVFRVKDVALLEKSKVGDKVRFKAVIEGGTLIVVDMQPIA